MTTHQTTRRSVAAALAGALVATAVAAWPSAAVAADPPPPTRSFHTEGNPILGDGTSYSADAAPLSVDGKLYVYAGHDEAAEQQGGFEMHDYQVFATDDPTSGDWDLYADNLDPDEVFSWATGDAAFAGQVTTGADGKFYWYAPVQWENTAVPNRMAIGVAVADSPVGPWTDAVGAPLLTWTDVFGSSTTGQEVIDPHVFTDTDGSVYLYWGSWSVARVVKLSSSMTALDGTIQTIPGLTGFFEAPWVFERSGTYYMAYDWKQGGSACTPSNYQACIAYATAPSALGPWTYQGIILGGTSATTVHPSIVEHEGRWWITYHTKDAVGGGHFRRSVAIDEVRWDGDRILPVEQSLADDPDYRLTDNVALAATASASFTEQPPMRLGAVNDGFRRTTALLPPDQWGNYRGTTSSHPSDWVQYTWDAPVRTGSVGIEFHRDGNWIRQPSSWVVEYLDDAGAWQTVTGATYPTATDTWHTVTFDTVSTTALRATFRGLDEGPYVHSVSVSEWEVYAVAADSLPEVEVATPVGTAPTLPAAVRASYGSSSAWVPVNWRPVDPADYAAEGTFTVEGRALGQKAGYVVATVHVGGTVDPGEDDTTAPDVSVSASGTSGEDGWFSSPVTVRVAADDDTSYLTTIETRVGDGAWTPAADARHVDVPVTAQGETVVSGRATDAAGNTSAEVSRAVKVDTGTPAVTAVLDDATRSVTVGATDTLSGVAAVEYRFDGTGDWVASEAGAVVEAPDMLPHELVVRARDRAGNTATATVTIPLGDGASLTGNVAPYATASASFTSGWENVAGMNDGTTAWGEDDASKYGASWGTWDRVGEQWAQLTWEFDVTVDRANVWWYQNVPDAQNEGLIAPRSWVLQYLDADGATWHDVALTSGEYARTSTGFVPVGFDAVTTRALRIVAQSWGAAAGQGSVGIHEWQVGAAEAAGVVTPAAPTFTPAEVCTDGVPEKARVVIPSTEGVVYAIDGTDATGTVEVAADAAVVVTARAADGYTLADGATTEWEHQFVAPDCPVEDIVVTPAAPVYTGPVCTDGDAGDGSLAVPTVEGVEYRVDGSAVTGTVTVALGALVTLTAVPLDGYAFPAGSQTVSWAYRADAPDCSPAAAVVPGSVELKGKARVGDTLTVSTTGWQPGGVRLAYTWFADGVRLDGVTGDRLQVPAALEGTSVTVKVTGFGTGLVTASATADPVGPVLPPKKGWDWPWSGGGWRWPWS